jgi:signal peptidase I
VALVGILLCAFGVREWVMDPVRVTSQSMEPTLHRNQVVLVQKLGYGRLSRNEVVAFHHPQTGVLTVKRVVGLPGDEVEIRDTVLFLNGKPVEEPDIDHTHDDGLFYGPSRVPAGTVFLMGDNRLESVDSRAFGAVPVERVAGRITVRLWPPALVH